MKLVNNWKTAYRMLSVQVLAVLTAVPVVWAQLPEESQALIPEEYRGYVLGFVALCGIAARLVDQGLGNDK